jgi:arylsulfatase A-like enzyme
MSDAAVSRPNVVLFHVDNLGYGELGCYGGGVLRGADTRRIDQFAAEGYQLLNYAPEAQCTPTRSALMTGRYAVRSGNHTVPFPGSSGGLVAWERTQGDLFSDAGYATMCLGKWHIGNADGRWPTDHGFDEWYGPEASYDEALWDEDPWYDRARDPVPYVRDARKGAPPERGPRPLSGR